MEWVNPLVPDAHYSESQDKPIFFTNSMIRSRFEVKLQIFIFFILGTNGLMSRDGFLMNSWLFRINRIPA